MQSFLAIITPLHATGDPGAHPEHPIVYPPVTWPPPGGGGTPQPPTPGHPAHPIYWPNPHPEHPIVLPPDKPVDPPAGGSPPYPAHPIILPGHPEHPIVIPPEQPPIIPDDKRLILVFVDGKWYWAVIDKPATPPPGYNPPIGGNVPQPVEGEHPSQHQHQG